MATMTTQDFDEIRLDRYAMAMFGKSRPLNDREFSEEISTFASNLIVFLSARPASPGPDTNLESLAPSEREYREQKEAFEAIEPLFLAQYQGQFVVSHNGEILDHDYDLATLTSRFITQRGDMPIYVTKIGGEDEALFATPFFQ